MLTVVSSPKCGGSVTYNPELCLNSTYARDTPVTLIAVSSDGYQFEKWTGDVDGVADTENSAITVVMSRDRIITVNFTAPGGLPTVTVEASPGVAGFVTIETPCGSLASDNVQAAISFECSAGTEVTLRATAAEGYRFRGWKGDLAGSQATVILVVDSSKTITARFAKPSPFPWAWVAAGIVASMLAAFTLARLVFGKAKRPEGNRPT
jgi:hypothetical protein